jgi:putative ubiquitin-RnfH superfamily antitoxin RatB of RatAB toxin-antitoxin module
MKTVLHTTNLINPIKILHKLRDAGFTEKQAEAQIEFISELTESSIATKSDIAEVKKEISDLAKELGIFKLEVKKDTESLDSGLRKEMDNLRAEVKKDLEILKSDLTVRITFIMSGLLALFAAVDKFLV